MRAPSKTVGLARELRRALTLPEVLLWQALRGGRLAGLRFRRQHPLGPFVLDFYCPAAKLAVEIDGSAHDHPAIAARDMARDAWLRQHGIEIMRIPASDVLSEGGRIAVLDTILAACAPSTASGGPPPPLRG